MPKGYPGKRVLLTSLFLFILDRFDFIWLLSHLVSVFIHDTIKLMKATSFKVGMMSCTSVGNSIGWTSIRQVHEMLHHRVLFRLMVHFHVMQLDLHCLMDLTLALKWASRVYEANPNWHMFRWRWWWLYCSDAVILIQYFEKKKGLFLSFCIFYFGICIYCRF